MTSRRVVVLALAGVSVGVWLAVAAGGRSASSVPASAGVGPVRSPLDPLIRDIQSQSLRLRQHLFAAQPLQPPSRDPFRFREMRGSRSEEPLEPALPVVAPSAQIDTAMLKLVGVAEDPSPGGPVRTAVITGMGELFLVKEGETFASRFQVAKIGSDAVQLVDLANRSTITLTLK